jgi:hypothetical protein
MLYSIFKFRREQAEQIEKVITDNLLVLKPENRYIISFPFEISDEDFDEVVEKISNSLDLENSDTHVVIVQGQVTMIEFS